jgi:hypothetical protein
MTLNQNVRVGEMNIILVPRPLPFFRTFLAVLAISLLETVVVGGWMAIWGGSFSWQVLWMFPANSVLLLAVCYMHAVLTRGYLHINRNEVILRKGVFHGVLHIPWTSLLGASVEHEGSSFLRFFDYMYGASRAETMKGSGRLNLFVTSERKPFFTLIETNLFRYRLRPDSSGNAVFRSESGNECALAALWYCFQQRMAMGLPVAPPPALAIRCKVISTLALLTAGRLIRRELRWEYGWITYRDGAQTFRFPAAAITGYEKHRATLGASTTRHDLTLTLSPEYGSSHITIDLMWLWHAKRLVKSCKYASAAFIKPEAAPEIPAPDFG